MQKTNNDNAIRLVLDIFYLLRHFPVLANYLNLEHYDQFPRFKVTFTLFKIHYTDNCGSILDCLFTVIQTDHVA